MLGLRDPPGVPGLGLPLGAPVPPPPARAPLAGPGRPPCGGAAAALAVAQVLAVLGPDRPAGHQQALPAWSRDGVGVNDAQVQAGDPGRVGGFPGRVGGDGDLGGHVHVKTPGGEAEGH